MQEESIKKAANDFLVDNTEFLEDNDTITIKLGVLKQKGYLPVNIKNPKTRKNISNESLITITKTGNTYKIELALVDLEDVTENIDNNSPILVLNGDYIEYVEVNNLYEEKGAIAKTATGETIDNISRQIKLNNVEKSSIDTSQLLTYNVIYSATDTNGKTTSATRTVIVRDTTSPTITFPSETTIHTSEVAAFNIMQGVSATDNYSTTPTITVNSSLAKLPGKYVITYIAKDSSNNETIERRVINVEDTFEKYYATLEYLESTGTQYIDTGVKFNSNTDKFELVYQASDAQGNYFIAGSGWQEKGKIWVYSYKDGKRFSIYITDTSNSQREFYGFGGPNTLKHIITYDAKKLYVDGILKADNSSYTFGETPFNFSLFNSINSTGYYAKTKIYSFKMWKSGILTRNMIPSMRKSDGALGLYDLVNNKFYGNSGTGTFGYKMQNENPYERLYTKLEYIESTGTQYIDTGIIANENTGFEIRFKTNNDLNNITYGSIFGARESSAKNELQISTYSPSSSSKGVLRYGTGGEYNADMGDVSSIQQLSLRNKIYTGNSGTTRQLSTTFTSPVPITVFALNQNGTITQHGKLRLYSFKLYDNNTLVRNFVPAVRNSDNKPGLYDEVNDIFYTNQGTAEFTKGNPVN